MHHFNKKSILVFPGQGRFPSDGARSFSWEVTNTQPTFLFACWSLTTDGDKSSTILQELRGSMTLFGLKPIWSDLKIYTLVIKAFSRLLLSLKSQLGFFEKSGADVFSDQDVSSNFKKYLHLLLSSLILPRPPVLCCSSSVQLSCDHPPTRLKPGTKTQN